MIAATKTQITDARAAFRKLSFRGSRAEFAAATALITGLLDGLQDPSAELQAECAQLREGMQILNEYHDRFGMTAVYAANLQEKLDGIAASTERDRQSGVGKADALHRTLKATPLRSAVLVVGALVAGLLGWELHNRLWWVFAAFCVIPLAYFGWLALRSCWFLYRSRSARRTANAQTDEIRNDLAIMARLTKDAETVFANELNSLRGRLGNVLDKLDAPAAE
jgi:hypothetical protein